VPDAGRFYRKWGSIRNIRLCVSAAAMLSVNERLPHEQANICPTEALAPLAHDFDCGHYRYRR
jgi:hypothetical protein